MTPTRGRQASFASTSNSDKSGKVPTAEASVTLISAQDCIVSVLDPVVMMIAGGMRQAVDRWGNVKYVIRRSASKVSYEVLVDEQKKPGGIMYHDTQYKRQSAAGPVRRVR